MTASGGGGAPFSKERPIDKIGLRIVGNKAGYGSVTDAQKALGSDCISKIDRA